MIKRIVAIGAIYAVAAFAWFVLGGTIAHRTGEYDADLRREVAGLWGDSQLQPSPEITFRWQATKTEKESIKNPETGEIRVVTKESLVWKSLPVILDRSELNVDLGLDQRRKGLLWYSTYGVTFAGRYSYQHEVPRAGFIDITYRFPTTQASYDEFRFDVHGSEKAVSAPVEDGGQRVVRQRVAIEPGQRVDFDIGYRSRGLDWWRYSFGDDVSQIKNFHLIMTTDFTSIDFPSGTISPDRKERSGEGWILEWHSQNLISGYQIGMIMPTRINPGPLAARISFFAPVSLLFFFAWIFVIGLLERIEIHPMNYVFLAAAFFAFHLLFSYTVDHIALWLAFVTSSLVSVFLVVSYLRLVVGIRFASLEAGISQLVYLVLFSYAHFFEGFTGLIVTIGSIITLFAVMQLTGRFDWSEKFAKPSLASPAAGPAGPS